MNTLALLLAMACTSSPDGDDSGEAEPVSCEAGEQRTYDTAADPSLSAADDPGLGFSSNDVADAFFDGFTGTLTTEEHGELQVDVQMSVDGLIVVQDYVVDGAAHPDCPSTWTAPLVFAMSTEKVGDAYVVDDLWSPDITLSDLTAASLSGDKPTSDFDGSLTISGDRIRVSAAFAAGWTGELAVDDATIGTFTLSGE